MYQRGPTGTEKLQLNVNGLDVSNRNGTGVCWWCDRANTNNDKCRKATEEERSTKYTEVLMKTNGLYSQLFGVRTACEESSSQHSQPQHPVDTTVWQFNSFSTGFGMTALTTGRITSYDFCQRISLADNEVPTGMRTATCHMSRGIKFLRPKSELSAAVQLTI